MKPTPTSPRIAIKTTGLSFSNRSSKNRRVLLVHGFELAPGVADALGDLEAVTEVDVGRGDVLVGIPEVLCVAAPDLDHSRKLLVVIVAASGKLRVISA